MNILDTPEKIEMLVNLAMLHDPHQNEDVVRTALPLYYNILVNEIKLPYLFDDIYKSTLERRNLIAVTEVITETLNDQWFQRDKYRDILYGFSVKSKKAISRVEVWAKTFDGDVLLWVKVMCMCECHIALEDSLDGLTIPFIAMPGNKYRIKLYDISSMAIDDASISIYFSTVQDSDRKIGYWRCYRDGGYGKLVKQHDILNLVISTFRKKNNIFKDSLHMSLNATLASIMEPALVIDNFLDLSHFERGDVFGAIEKHCCFDSFFIKGKPLARTGSFEGVLENGKVPWLRCPSIDSVLPLSPVSTFMIDSIEAYFKSVSKHERPNIVKIQHYKDGSASIAQHADKILDMAPGTNIIILSFGATRTMVLEPKKEYASIFDRELYTLKHNSMICITPEKNAFFTHGIPMEMGSDCGERISMVFRTSHTFADFETGKLSGPMPEFDEKWLVELWGIEHTRSVDHEFYLQNTRVANPKITCNWDKNTVLSVMSSRQKTPQSQEDSTRSRLPREPAP